MGYLQTAGAWRRFPEIKKIVQSDIVLGGCRETKSRGLVWQGWGQRSLELGASRGRGIPGDRGHADTGLQLFTTLF